MRTLPAALLLAVPALLCAQGADPAGRWEGAIEIPGSPLQVQLELAQAAGAWTGRLSIPQQGAKDLAVDRLQVGGGKVAFILPGIPGEPAFRGELAAGGLQGQFSQGGRTFPFRLARAGAAADAARRVLEGLDAEIERIRADWKVPGLSVAVVKGGEVVLAKGYGLRDTARKLPMTADTLLAIGSVTKSFTTAVMASLVDEGRLSWESPVRTWIPWFRLQDPVATDRMTPLDLVTHRSGMPRHDMLWYNASASREDMVRRLRHLEPNKDFRTDFQYNNAMFLTAGYLTEVVSGAAWEENVRARVFRPLGMDRANFSVADSRKDADFSEPYEEEKDGSIRLVPMRNITNVGPAGAINASAREMAAWLKLHLGDGRVGGRQVLSPASLTFLHTPRMLTGAPQTQPEVVPGGYAPGWFTDVYRGHLRVYHGGNIDGFSAMAMLLPSDGLGIVVLANLGGTAARDLLPRVIIDRLLGLEARDWSGEGLAQKREALAKAREGEARKRMARKPGTAPSHPLADYAGTYEHPGYGTATVTLEGGRLVLACNGIRTPFEHWHYDVFNGLKAEDPVFEDQKLQFLTGLDGDIDALAMGLEPAVAPIRFVRKAEARLSDPAFLARFEGTYVLGSQTEARVFLRGQVLSLDVKGQATRELEPLRGTRFAIKGLPSFFVQFTLPGAGPATEVQFDQPNGIFTAPRKP
ncbi:serine hydrolase [Mesoterricola sediminis]|uniref:Serine hydrolase n=1 Tax=Mesoterricola sediminis TaxID=2927980 RepID=A0AA48GTW4_9BACT|nr:serine hydrolase [Mesoterricola sediminis]BDU75565.1 hypothetical protein METESE_05230 [Mesoterricola sediminis]